ARTDVKATFSFEPSPESAVMMATDMPAAISAYSMAVAPLSSRAKRARSSFMIQNSTGHLARLQVNHRRASISLPGSLKLSAIHSFRFHERRHDRSNSIHRAIAGATRTSRPRNSQALRHTLARFGVESDTNKLMTVMQFLDWTPLMGTRW